MHGTLYLVPNLLGLIEPQRVLPAHTIAVARSLRHFIVENAKPARQFLKSLALDVPISSLGIVEVPDKATADACAALLQPARDGADVGLVSDAGCPGIADPGAAVVSAAHRAGVRVVPLVGPCSLVLGLMASGMNGQAFSFHGYLPVAHDARIGALRRLDEEIARTGATQTLHRDAVSQSGAAAGDRRDVPAGDALLRRRGPHAAYGMDRKRPGERLATSRPARDRQAPRAVPAGARGVSRWAAPRANTGVRSTQVVE